MIVDGRSEKSYFPRLVDAFPRGAPVRVATREDLPEILAEVGLGSELQGTLDGP